ncbi:MAG TPA: hypothetical protein VK348_04540 [Planctomycetota bacterium]|nr:hypothetical protein [Planctomycetota bacterium]
MTVGAALPRQPLVHLRCSTTDVLRSLLLRRPDWRTVGPAHERMDGDAVVLSYRLDPRSFAIEVRLRRDGDTWREHDFAIVPGAQVALQLVLDGLRPTEVSSLLDLEPTHASIRGAAAPRLPRGDGLWRHEVPGEGQPEARVAELLAVLHARPGWRLVVAHPGVVWAGIAVHFHGCQEQMGGFVLDQAVVEQLFGLSLQFDVEVSAD